jgi:hypothetical protein
MIQHARRDAAELRRQTSHSQKMVGYSLERLERLKDVKPPYFGVSAVPVRHVPVQAAAETAAAAETPAPSADSPAPEDPGFAGARYD